MTYVPHTSGSEVGNHQRVRAGSHPHMSHSTQAMNPPFQQMVEFFHHMAESMHDPNWLTLRKWGSLQVLMWPGSCLCNLSSLC